MNMKVQKGKQRDLNLYLLVLPPKEDPPKNKDGT
jgi:hypothetical protein